MKTFAFLLLLVFALQSKAQDIQSLGALSASPSENITNRKLFGDSLVSSFGLFIRKEVKLHRHNAHSEHVYVLEGEADMQLGTKKIHVKAGDLVFIPKAVPHSVHVTSSVPLKVLSVQAPFFDGRDREVLE